MCKTLITRHNRALFKRDTFFCSSRHIDFRTSRPTLLCVIIVIMYGRNERTLVIVCTIVFHFTVIFIGSRYVKRVKKGEKSKGNRISGSFPDARTRVTQRTCSNFRIVQYEVECGTCCILKCSFLI